jgi:hypothetical protein
LFDHWFEWDPQAFRPHQRNTPNMIASRVSIGFRSRQLLGQLGGIFGHLITCLLAWRVAVVRFLMNMVVYEARDVKMTISSLPWFMDTGIVGCAAKTEIKLSVRLPNQSYPNDLSFLKEYRFDIEKVTHSSWGHVQSSNSLVV